MCIVLSVKMFIVIVVIYIWVHVVIPHSREQANIKYHVSPFCVTGPLCGETAVLTDLPRKGSGMYLFSQISNANT